MNSKKQTSMKKIKGTNQEHILETDQYTDKVQEKIYSE